MTVELSQYETITIAAAAYEVHRRYCLLLDPHSTDHPLWDDLGMEFQEIAYRATDGIIRLDHDAEKSHYEWVMSKRAKGWTHGPKKNPSTKEHPCLVQFSELPFEQQTKDKLWVSTVNAMLAAKLTIPQS